MVLDRHLKGTRRALEALEERLRLGQSKGTLGTRELKALEHLGSQELGYSNSIWALRHSIVHLETRDI